MPESETRFWNSHWECILAEKLLPGGQYTTLTVQEQMQERKGKLCPSTISLAQELSCSTYSAVAAPEQGYWSHWCPVVGEMHFQKLNLGWEGKQPKEFQQGKILASVTMKNKPVWHLPKKISTYKLSSGCKLTRNTQCPFSWNMQGSYMSLDEKFTLHTPFIN